MAEKEWGVGESRGGGERGTPGLRGNSLPHHHLPCPVPHAHTQIAADEAEWLDVVALNAADGPTWAPEVLHYGVADAPAFVLLGAGGGAALARTGPVGVGGGGGGGGEGGVSVREGLLTGLDAIVEAGRPKGREGAGAL